MTRLNPGRQHETAHIRTEPRSRTICGAPVTAADVTHADAVLWMREAWTQGPAKCPTCFATLQSEVSR